MCPKEIDPPSCRVAVLAGGKSRECDVSLASGNGASEALREAGFQVEILDPLYVRDLKRLIDEPFDVAFICLHGKDGEDGVIQGFLELLEIPYIGSGIWASATAINKAKAKQVYQRAGLSTPPFRICTRREQRTGALDYDAIVKTVGERCVVKATTEGSSLGIFMTNGTGELASALNEAFGLYEEVIVERYMSGTEFTVVVLGNEDARALPVIKIVPANVFYDYEAKYAPGGSKHFCPAPIDDALRDLLQTSAERAHCALECAGVSRSDFIVDDEGVCWILETNTIPGMTKTSLLPDAARAAGMSFSETCTELIRLAFERSGAGKRNPADLESARQA